MKCMPLFASAALLGAGFAAPSVAQVSVFLGSMMFGNQVPVGGEEGATGDFNAAIEFAKGQICYYLEFDELPGADGANIYQAEKGKSGPAVVPLPLSDGADEVCTSVDKTLLEAIAKQPTDYYIAVRTPEHPDGAIRGQLD